MATAAYKTHAHQMECVAFHIEISEFTTTKKIGAMYIVHPADSAAWLNEVLGTILTYFLTSVRYNSKISMNKIYI